MGEQPWLFRRDGEDWRWLSWSRAAERIADLRRAVGGQSGRKAYRSGPSPDAYLVDLALRIEGFVPVAIEMDEPAEVDLEERLSVLDEGQPTHPDSMPELRTFDRLLGETSDRDVVVIANGPVDPLDRLLLDWTLLHRGAAAFEHDPARLFLTLIWARPTILHGSSTLLAGLTKYLAEQPKPRKQLTKRARLALDGGPEGLDEKDSSLWEDHGVEVIDVSGSFGTRSASE